MAKRAKAIYVTRDESMEKLMEFFEPYVKAEFRTWSNFVDMAIKKLLYSMYKEHTPDELREDFTPRILTKKLKTADLDYYRKYHANKREAELRVKAESKNNNT